MNLRELDVADLEARLAPVGISGVRPLSGGASGLTYSGLREGRRVAVKVAPPGLAPVLNRDVLRQARLLKALRDTEVPVPEVIWEDRGDPPDVPPLFVMSFVEGRAFEPLFDRDIYEDDEIVGDSFRAAAKMLAVLHRLDPVRLGFGDEPQVAPADEVARWSRSLETVDADLVPGWPDVAALLNERLPGPHRPALVHGDFRLGNILTLGGCVQAAVDWEIWSVGDPRVDLGWFLLNADPQTYARVIRYGSALPSRQELIGLYCDGLGSEPADVAWFEALAGFKSTATWSLIVKHNRRRSEPDADIEKIAAVLAKLLNRATDLLSRGSSE